MEVFGGEVGMRDFIARDREGNIVGKWRRHNAPDLENYEIEEVSDVSEFSVDYWFNSEDQ